MSMILQVNDFSLVQALVDTYNEKLSTSTNLTIVLSIFIGINVVITLLNIWSQFKLKSKEKGIIAFNLREEKKVEVQEAIFKKLDRLALLDFRNSNMFLGEIQLVDNFLNENKLHINKKLLEHIYAMLDYFKEITVNHRKKDYNNEMKLFDKYCKLYNS